LIFFVRMKSRKLMLDLSCITQSAYFCYVKRFPFRETRGLPSLDHM
jgi:hypothetical protein